MMMVQMKVGLTAALLISCVLLSSAVAPRRKERGEIRRPSKNTDTNIKVRRNYTTANDRRPDAATPRRKVKKAGRERVSMTPASDISCTRLGGICQPNRYICQGRYLKDKCSRAKTGECCVPVGAWSVLCARHHHNRVRACDTHGCGAFNTKRANGLHKAVDLVCEDYGIINAPFAGSLAGPVSRQDPFGNQYDGVKLFNDVSCVKIFNIRPYRYAGPAAQGEALGYLLPLQERFSGITSHLELQMCDGTDPSPYI